MKTSMCVSLFLFCYASFAQQPFDEQIKSSRFEIIKNTIEFLAKDGGTFKNVQKTSCEACKTYPDLENFIKVNNLTGAAMLLGEWKNAPISVTPARGKQDLDRFRASVIAKVTAGQEKMKRRQLPAFDAYEKKLNDIVASVDDYDEPAANTKGAITDSEVHGSPQVLRETAPAVIGASSPADTAKTPGQPPSSLLPYIGYGAAGLFALLALYFYNNLNNIKQTNATLKRTMADLTVSQGASETSNRALQSRVKQLEEALKESKRQHDTLQERLKKEKDKNKQFVAAATRPEVKAEEVKPATPALPQVPPTITRFARYADLEDGFSTNELLEHDDNETIFEITILPSGSATYKVADNEKAQRYALTNVSYFLSNTCWYDSFPKLNDTIQTDEPGKLQLQGSKWQIINPAKISFI